MTNIGLMLVAWRSW